MTCFPVVAKVNLCLHTHTRCFFELRNYSTLSKLSLSMYLVQSTHGSVIVKCAAGPFSEFGLEVACARINVCIRHWVHLRVLAEDWILMPLSRIAPMR